LETARTIGASERAARFAAAKFRGASNTLAAKEAGYGAGGNPGSVRSEGYRLYRSNKVTQLLSLAAAEAGGGIDGCVQPQEVKQILSHLARGSDPQVRIKALDSLAKMQEREQEAARSDPEPTLQEQFVAVIAALPQSGIGAALAMGTYFDKVGNIFNFPFLELCAPIVHQNFPTEWQRFRNGVHRLDMAEYLDKCADGIVVGGDDLVNAVRSAASSSTRHKPIKEDADVA
jgi:hypothetical protein